MFRKLEVTDADIDEVLNEAYDKFFPELEISDEERAYYAGVAETIDWMIGEDVGAPKFESK